MSTKPAGYSATQITLHWIIAVLVIFQLIMGEDIKPAYRAFSRGNTPAEADLFWANIHVYVGIAIFVLALLRVVVLLRRGAPEPPADEHRLLKMAARATHGILYLVILGMPISGGVAWYFGIHDAGEVHEMAKPVIIAVVVLHVAAALWHHFVKRNDVLKRMVRPA